MREDTTRFLLDSLVALTDDERAALPGVALGPIVRAVTEINDDIRPLPPHRRTWTRWA